MQAEILSNNELAAVASQKCAFVSLQNSRPIPVPEELKIKYLENQKGNLKDYL